MGKGRVGTGGRMEREARMKRGGGEARRGKCEEAGEVHYRKGLKDEEGRRGEGWGGATRLPMVVGCEREHRLRASELFSAVSDGSSSPVEAGRRRFHRMANSVNMCVK